MKINLKYQKLLPKLLKAEYEALKQSVKNEGQHYPIIVNADGTILDGHNRYSICQELGVDPLVEVWRSFASALEEKKFVIECNLLRRHLTDFQKVELSYPLLEIERELAKQRRESTLPKKGDKTGHFKPLSSNELHGQARDVVARKVGVSPTTFQRALAVMEKAPEKLKEKVRRGKTSISYAYSSIQTKERHTAPPKLPEGKYAVIYADPPWKYNLPLRGSPNLHYNVMSQKELCSLEIPAAKDAILFLWATNPMLEEALQVIKAWGFTYKTNMVWVKHKFGTGYYLRGQHELLLIAKKGKIPVPMAETRPSSVLAVNVGEHSVKPVEVYQIIEQLYPNRKYLELFAREKKAGWTSWGMRALASLLPHNPIFLFWFLQR